MRPEVQFLLIIIAIIVIPKILKFLAGEDVTQKPSYESYGKEEAATAKTKTTTYDKKEKYYDRYCYTCTKKFNTSDGYIEDGEMHCPNCYSDDIEFC